MKDEVPKLSKMRFVSAPQRHLYKLLEELFHRDQILLDHYHKELRYDGTKAPVQLDIFIPSLNLAFEYQGEQHYSTHYLYGSPSIQQQRDQEKEMKCKEAGITLIHIPYWWDKQKSSLVATIRQYRSDLLKQELSGTPIPTQPSSPSMSPMHLTGTYTNYFILFLFYINSKLFPQIHLI